MFVLETVRSLLYGIPTYLADTDKKLWDGLDWVTDVDKAIHFNTLEGAYATVDETTYLFEDLYLHSSITLRAFIRPPKWKFWVKEKWIEDPKQTRSYSSVHMDKCKKKWAKEKLDRDK